MAQSVHNRSLLDVITQRVEFDSVERVKQRIQDEQTVKGYWGMHELDLKERCPGAANNSM